MKVNLYLSECRGMNLTCMYYMLQTLHQQMAASVHEISNLIDPVAVAARSEASQLGHKVKHRTTLYTANTE